MKNIIKNADGSLTYSIEKTIQPPVGYEYTGEYRVPTPIDEFVDHNSYYEGFGFYGIFKDAVNHKGEYFIVKKKAPVVKYIQDLRMTACGKIVTPNGTDNLIPLQLKEGCTMEQCIATMAWLVNGNEYKLLTSLDTDHLINISKDLHCGYYKIPYGDWVVQVVDEIVMGRFKKFCTKK